MVSDPPENMAFKLLIYAIISVIVILQHIPSEVLFYRFFSKANRTVELRLRSALCQRLQQLSIPFHKNSKMGILQTKILRDVENLTGLTSSIIQTIPVVFGTLAVALFMTARRAPQFLLFYLIVVPIAVVVHRLSRHKLRSYNHEFRLGVESMSGRVIEMLRMVTVTRAHSVENAEM